MYRKFAKNHIFALKNNDKWGKNQEKLAEWKARKAEISKKDKAAPKVAPKKKAVATKPAAATKGAPQKTQAKPAAAAATKTQAKPAPKK